VFKVFQLQLVVAVEVVQELVLNHAEAKLVLEVPLQD
jgi:hypothetical protein